MTEEIKSEGEGFLGSLLDKAKEFGEKAAEVAGDAFEAAKEFTGEAVEKVKDFAEDLPENAQKFAGEAQKLAGEAVEKVKDLVDGDEPTQPPAPTA